MDYKIFVSIFCSLFPLLWTSLMCMKFVQPNLLNEWFFEISMWFFCISWSVLVFCGFFCFFCNSWSIMVLLLLYLKECPAFVFKKSHEVSCFLASFVSHGVSYFFSSVSHGASRFLLFFNLMEYPGTFASFESHGVSSFWCFVGILWNILFLASFVSHEVCWFLASFVSHRISCFWLLLCLMEYPFPFLCVCVSHGVSYFSCI